MQEEKWLDANGAKIFYRKTGIGMPIVLVHGFAEDGNIWRKQVDALNKYFQIITPDLPGSGKSVCGHQPSSVFPNKVDDYADCIKAILDAEEIKSCIMIGHSMGGYITLAFAGKYAKTLKGFGLFHSTAYADSEEKKTTRKKSIDFIQKHGARDFIKQSAPNLFSYNTKKNHPEMVEELICTYDNFNPDALVSYYEAMIQRPDRTSVLRSFKAPILFIIGENDNAVPLEHSLQQSYIPGISYIHILENVGHMGMWEATDEVNNFLTFFIKNTAL